jgi:hypothetical protein
MLGRGEGGGPFTGGDEEAWVDPGDLGTAFEETALEDPRQALAEARGQAGRASREATEHATPASRVQPPIPPSPDAVPDYEPDDEPDFPDVTPGQGMTDEGEQPPR